MTDNEIIKALEHCYGKAATVGCSGCPLKENGACLMILEKESVELVKRQKAEIERLKDYNKNLHTVNTALSNEILDIKSEAIKEFAERVKEKAVWDVLGDTKIVYEYEIDKIAKAIMEGNNAE